MQLSITWLHLPSTCTVKHTVLSAQTHTTKFWACACEDDWCGSLIRATVRGDGLRHCERLGFRPNVLRIWTEFYVQMNRAHRQQRCVVGAFSPQSRIHLSLPPPHQQPVTAAQQLQSEQTHNQKYPAVFLTWIDSSKVMQLRLWWGYSPCTWGMHVRYQVSYPDFPKVIILRWTQSFISTVSLLSKRSFQMKMKVAGDFANWQYSGNVLSAMGIFLSSLIKAGVLCVVLCQATFYCTSACLDQVSCVIFQTNVQMSHTLYAWYYDPSSGILANEMFHNLPSNTHKMCLIGLLCPGASCASIWLWNTMKSHHDQRVCQQSTEALEAWRRTLAYRSTDTVYKVSDTDVI